MRPDPIVVLIDPAVAASVRRNVGPTAWVVPEALVASSPPTDTGVVGIDSSVRDLARDAGLSKDTIARAMRRLIEAGIVGRNAGRDQDSGRFGRSTYLVDLEVAGLSVRGRAPSWCQPDTATSVTVSGPAQLVSDGQAGGDQRTLLDVDR